MLATLALLALTEASSSAVAFSVEDVFGLSFQRFGDAGSGRLVHLGAFPLVTGVRVGLHRVSEGGLVLGGLVGGSTSSVTYDAGDPSRTTFLTLAPRAGYAFGGPTLGAWVRGGPTVRVTSSENQKSKAWLDLSVEFHLIWTFAPGVALLVGPSLEVGVAKPEKRHAAVGLLSGLRVTL